MDIPNYIRYIEFKFELYLNQIQLKTSLIQINDISGSVRDISNGGYLYMTELRMRLNSIRDI